MLTGKIKESKSVLQISTAKYHYKGINRDANSINFLNKKINNKFHRELVRSKCEGTDCDNKICPSVCNNLTTEDSLGHLTSNPKIPASELVDKKPFTLDRRDNVLKQKKPQYAIAYKKKLPTNTTEYAEDKATTAFLNQPHVLMEIEKETTK